VVALDHLSIAEEFLPPPTIARYLVRLSILSLGSDVGKTKHPLALGVCPVQDFRLPYHEGHIE
jgi:hypothetical protein